MGGPAVWTTVTPWYGWKLLVQGGITVGGEFYPLDSRCDVLAASQPFYAVLAAATLLGAAAVLGWPWLRGRLARLRGGRGGAGGR